MSDCNRCCSAICDQHDAVKLLLLPGCKSRPIASHDLCSFQQEQFTVLEPQQLPPCRGASWAGNEACAALGPRLWAGVKTPSSGARLLSFRLSVMGEHG